MSGTQALELWASADVCDSLGWTRHRLKLARGGEGFPEPRHHVQRGQLALWDAADVRGWFADSGARESTREWRRAEAVRMYRRGVKPAEIGRQLRMKRDTAVKYLRDAGEVVGTQAP